MKLAFNKIASGAVEILEHLSEDIVRFQFTKLREDILEERFVAYKKVIENPLGVSEKSLRKVYEGAGYSRLGTIDELMAHNIKHCFAADMYFTNGQQVITVLKSAETYEVGLHDYHHFQAYFPPLTGFYRFTLQNLNCPTFPTLEQVYSYVTSLLSNVRVRRIQVADGVLEIQPRLSHTYLIRYQEKSYELNTSYPNKNLDSQFDALIAQLQLGNAKCCINCVHFESITAGHLKNSKLNGYCRRVVDQLGDKRSTTHMWSWCHEFAVG